MVPAYDQDRYMIAIRDRIAAVPLACMYDCKASALSVSLELGSSTSMTGMFGVIPVRKLVPSWKRKARASAGTFVRDPPRTQYAQYALLLPVPYKSRGLFHFES